MRGIIQGRPTYSGKKLQTLPKIYLKNLKLSQRLNMILQNFLQSRILTKINQYGPMNVYKINIL